MWQHHGIIHILCATYAKTRRASGNDTRLYQQRQSRQHIQCRRHACTSIQDTGRRTHFQSTQRHLQQQVFRTRFPDSSVQHNTPHTCGKRIQTSSCIASKVQPVGCPGVHRPGAVANDPRRRSHFPLHVAQADRAIPAAVMCLHGHTVFLQAVDTYSAHHTRIDLKGTCATLRAGLARCITALFYLYLLHINLDTSNQSMLVKAYDWDYDYNCVSYYIFPWALRQMLFRVSIH